MIIAKLIRTNVAMRFRGAAVQMGQWLSDTVDQTGVVSQRHVSWVEGDPVGLINRLVKPVCAVHKNV